MQPSKGAATAKATGKWLCVVGIGEDGLAGLGREALAAIGEAEFVFGGARHLKLAENAIRGETRPWPAPFDTSLKAVRDLHGRRVCILASGDPFLHGVGVTLARHVEPAEMAIFPAPSAFSMAASRLGWALADCETISLHGRPVDLLRPLLHPGRRVIALTSDGETPGHIARLLETCGFEASRIHVLEALGGKEERIVSGRSGDIEDTFHPLNVVAIEVAMDGDARILPLAGLSDDLLEHDGQITKAPMRALTLAALAPRRGELLWDIGAGSGSIAISWMLCGTSLRAIAVEEKPDRAERIARNASACGVPGLQVVQDLAPGALTGLEPPDAIFIGGGVSDTALMDAAVGALRPDGRLVANAVTLEGQAELLRRHAALGGQLAQIAVSHAAPLGGMTGWRPAMPVVQWSWVKR